MRPVGPVLRLPPALAAPRAWRRRPAGLVVALGLVLVAVAPPAGAPDRSSSGTAPSSHPRIVAAPRADPPLPEVPDLAGPPGTTTLVSANRNKGFPNAASSAPSISENGRWIAFASVANDLVAKDTNNAQDIFVRDRGNGSTIRLNLPGNAVPPAGC